MTHMLTFHPAQTNRACEDLVLQIEAAISGGQIQPGERLPSERNLQAQFLTGRGVVREALRILQQKGLIEVRKGAKGGAFVKKVDASKASESLALFLKQHDVDPEYLIEFRESLDRAITTLAISRATPEEKSELLRKSEEMRDAISSEQPDMEMLTERDRELNLLFAGMTRNPVFKWTMQAIQKGFSSYDLLLYMDPEYRDATASNWADTAQAIKDNEPMIALAHVSQHYALLRRRIRGKKGPDLKPTRELMSGSVPDLPETPDPEKT